MNASAGSEFGGQTPSETDITFREKNRSHYFELGTELQAFLSITELKLVDSTIDCPHHVKKVQSTQTPVVESDGAVMVANGEKYDLGTSGVLTDEDLHYLAKKQEEPNQELLIGIEGLKHQISIYEEDPH